MRKLLLLIMLPVLCFNQLKAQNNEDVNLNELRKVTLNDKALESFLKAYIDTVRETESNGVFVLNVYYQNSDFREYGVSLRLLYKNKGSTTVPLAYTEINQNIILIYSGIEQYFPSKKRRQIFWKLVRSQIKLAPISGVLPNLDFPSGRLVVCGNDRVIESNIAFNANHTPCVIEEPPLEH